MPGVAQRVPRKLRFPDFMTTAQDGGRLSPAAFTPRKYSWYSFLLEAQSTPGRAIGRIMSLKRFQWHHLGSNQRPSDLKHSILTTVLPRSTFIYTYLLTNADIMKAKTYTIKYGFLIFETEQSVRDFVPGLYFFIVFFILHDWDSCCGFRTHARTHTLREICTSDQECTNPGRRVVQTKFCRKPNSCHPPGAHNFECFLDSLKICTLLPWARGHLLQRAKSIGIFLPLSKTVFLKQFFVPIPRLW